jgi:hypothetical protein
MVWKREVIGMAPFIPHLKEGGFWHHKCVIINVIIEVSFDVIIS